MKLVIPKSLPNIHLLQADKGPSLPPLAGAYPVFHDGAKSSKRLESSQPEPDTMPFGEILSTAAQLAYRQLKDTMELLPQMNNVEKKQHLIGACLKNREIFYKLAIVADFLASRQNDVSLMGLKALQSYSGVLTQVADSLAIAVENIQALNSVPKLLPEPALNLISGYPAYCLPSILVDEFRTEKPLTNEERSFWIQRLDNTIKSAACTLEFSPTVRFLSIETGILTLSFARGIVVKLTLVPIFESNSAGWHILSIDLGPSVSEQTSLALLVQLQMRYNRRDDSAFVTDLEKDLLLFSTIKLYNEILDSFSRLSQLKAPQMEIKYTTRFSALVQPWSAKQGEDSPQLNISVNLSEFTISATANEEKRLIDLEDLDFDTFACSCLDDLVRKFSCKRLEELCLKLAPLASSSWILFDEAQIRLDSAKLVIEQLVGEVCLVMDPLDGTLKIKHDCPDFVSDLPISSFTKLDAFVKAIKDLRLKQLTSLLLPLLKCKDELIVVDGTCLGLASVSPNHIVFALKHFYGKIIVVELLDNCSRIHYGEEDLVSGRYRTHLLSQNSETLPVNSLHVLGSAIEAVVQNALATTLELECKAHSVLVEQIDQLSLALLSIGSPPSVASVILRLLSPQKAAFEIDFSLNAFNFDYVHTSLTGPKYLLAGQGRFHFSHLFGRLRAFMALLFMSKQLELKKIRHELEPDRLSFGHDRLGRFRIFYFAPTEGLPLSVAVEREDLVSAEHLKALQNQVRSSSNIEPLVEFANTIVS